MTRYLNFAPDLIIEATSVCDRDCPGCYAPNVVSREAPSLLYRLDSSLFLQPAALEQALAALSEWPGTLSIRGGEPTRHPELPAILALCSTRAGTVWLETHGRWATTLEAKGLLGSIEATRTRVKLSFDRMHGLATSMLREIVSRLRDRNILFAVAITEPNASAFRSVRNEIPWLPDEQIIFQPKVSNLSRLLTPRYGVIRTSGVLAQVVSTRSSFFREEATA